MRTGNQILDALPENEAREIHGYLEPVEFRVAQVLSSPTDESGFAYFPVSGVISLLRGFENGAVIEVGVVGREGMTGIHAFLGETLEPNHAIVQCEGRGFRISDVELRRLFRKGGSLQTLLLKFTYCLIAQISQTAACNQLHLADQRLSRWLLAMSDRIDDAVIPLTHEFLAHMLGASRARVSEALRRFRDGGAVESRRNQIVIRDRQKLESWACECYEEVRNIDDSLPPANQARMSRTGSNP